MNFALFWILLALLVGVIAWFVGDKTWLRQRSRTRTSSRKKALATLHVRPRRILTGTEREVWRWLQTVFPDHHIMVKMPMTRFTLPGRPEERSQAFSYLSNLYCTFTICNQRARVIGCVDVADGNTPASGANQELKQAVLSQCDMAYWVLLPQSMPEVSILRAAFLGNSDRKKSDFIGLETNYGDLESAREHLVELLDRQRSTRFSESDAEALLDPSVKTPSAVPAWSQADSFLMPLEEQRKRLPKDGSQD